MFKEYDIEVPLPKSAVSSTKRWVKQFNRQQRILITFPEVVGGVLRMNAADASTLFAYYANPKDSNEFDVYRLKATMISSVEMKLSRCRSEYSKKHYRSCLDGLRKRISFKGNRILFKQPKRLSLVNSC